MRTARLRLAAPVSADAEELFPLLSDPQLTIFLAWEPHRSVEETRAMIDALAEAQQADRSYHWLARAEHGLVGLVSLIDLRRKHRSFTWQRAELAYWTAVPAQGRGYATEAARAVVACGFGALGLHKIAIYHAVDNPPSGEVARKLGFRFVGDEREAFCKHGRWHDLRHHELLVSEHRETA